MKSVAVFHLPHYWATAATTKQTGLSPRLSLRHTACGQFCGAHVIKVGNGWKEYGQKETPSTGFVLLYYVKRQAVGSPSFTPPANKPEASSQHFLLENGWRRLKGGDDPSTTTVDPFHNT